MSWFSGFTNALQEVTEQVGEAAKNALPIDPETLEKLTLTTPELAAERKRIDEEEKRKEHIKDCLAGMLPWETRDPERDILVEECKEAILKLSKEETTFKGPYLMPGLAVKLTESDEKQEGDEEDEDDVDEEEEAKKQEEKPSEESLDKLSALSPLPKLLDDFDLDAHVGLIQRLLTEDPQLVKMQSKLSGGGEREHYFWKNFFFHCAYARYEAGLSIDEIWSDEDPMERKAKQEAEKQAAADKAASEQGVAPASASEEEITFDEDTTKPTDETAFASPEPDTEVVSAEIDTTAADPTLAASVVSSSAADSSANGFENISSDNIIEDDDAFGDDGFDVELDELEAEIARELED